MRGSGEGRVVGKLFLTAVVWLGLSVFGFIWSFQEVVSWSVEPVGRVKDVRVEFLVDRVGLSRKIAKEIVIWSEVEGVDFLLVTALFWTESNFNPKAKSSLGYYGVSQIPWRLPWTDVQVVSGIRIFKEKVRIAEGDVWEAVLRYKGYSVGSSRGWEQVRKVRKLYGLLRREFEHYKKGEKT